MREIPETKKNRLIHGALWAAEHLEQALLDYEAGFPAIAKHRIHDVAVEDLGLLISNLRDLGLEELAKRAEAIQSMLLERDDVWAVNRALAALNKIVDDLLFKYR